MALTIHRYPRPLLLFDGLRASLGLSATLGPLLFLDVIPVLALFLGLLGGVFVLFAAQIVVQSLSTIEVSDQHIVIRGLNAKTLDWRDLSTLKLAFYASARQRGEGWYRLSLSGAGTILKLESTIEGFETIVLAASDAARSAGIMLDPTTGENLTALGYETDR